MIILVKKILDDDTRLGLQLMMTLNGQNVFLSIMWEVRQEIIDPFRQFVRKYDCNRYY